MSKQTQGINDPVVTAIDRASEAKSRLAALISRVEEAIVRDKEQIRAACPHDGGVNAMSRALLHHLQQEQSRAQPWASVALGEALSLIDLKKLTRSIWPELREARRKEKTT
jgi:hypothetical protein